MQPPSDDPWGSAIVQMPSSEEVEPSWEQMVADTLTYLTPAQRVLEKLARGLVRPMGAVLSCVDASHGVALAMVALADAAACVVSQDSNTDVRAGFSVGVNR
jgi:hypothetical protein